MSNLPMNTRKLVKTSVVDDRDSAGVSASQANHETSASSSDTAGLASLCAPDEVAKELAKLSALILKATTRNWRRYKQLPPPPTVKLQKLLARLLKWRNACVFWRKHMRGKKQMPRRPGRKLKHYGRKSMIWRTGNVEIICVFWVLLSLVSDHTHTIKH